MTSHGATHGIFRKRPVSVYACQYKQYGQTDWPEGWKTDNWHYSGTQLVIPTLEGSMCADVGDWIVCGIKGEFYPVKPAIFEATYERV